MVYLIGDTHGGTRIVQDYCKRLKMTENDILIILGDAGYNYHLDDRDRIAKNRLKKLKPTIFCIHGNHECRPEHIPTYKTKEWHGGTVWYEEKYPKLLFARDGDIFDFDGKKCLVIGGAYSIDKKWRLKVGGIWWEDEQPSEEIKKRTIEALKKGSVDIILSHTCPLKYEPVEAFLPQFDQSKIDKSTERFLDEIEDNFEYKRWYCGHYHIIKTIDKIHFMFENIEALGE